jgi:hypothetical protein
VDGGIAAVEAAVGDPRAVAPFFRVPGLRRSRAVESFLAAKSLAVWSADEVADDWHRGITAKQIVKLAMRRIEAKGHRGVLLLHDIHPATATALPLLLKELKAQGYRIVQAVPAGPRPASVPDLVAKATTDGGPPQAARTPADHAPKAKPARHAHHHRRHRAAETGDEAVERASTGPAQNAQTADSSRGALTLWR